MAKRPEFVLEFFHKRIEETNNKILTRKLASELFAIFPQSFTNYENARSFVRYKRNQHNENKKNKNYVPNEPYVHDVNRYNIPASMADTISHFIIQRKKALIISDLHFPFHSVESIEVALDYGVSKGADAIVINGDLLDFTMISRHEQDWRSRDVYTEFEQVRSFLENLRKSFPSTTIIFKEGNHDERWEKWLYNKAPEIFKDPEFKLDARLRLGELNIQYVADRQLMKFGNLFIAHGHEFIGGGGGGKNPANSLGNKFNGDMLTGHFHKTSHRIDTDSITRHNRNIYTTGCLSTLNPYYARINQWNNGFAYGECDLVTGEYEIENLRIENKKIKK